MPKRPTIQHSKRRTKRSKRKAPKTKRVLPPVSKATGGLLPGIDLTHFSDYQEMEDLEYFERMKRFK